MNRRPAIDLLVIIVIMAVVTFGLPVFVWVSFLEIGR